MKKYNCKDFAARIGDHYVRFACYTTSTRAGFCHTVVSLDYDTTDTKVTYYNRTWERFDYETALSRAIDKLPKDVRETVRRQIIDGEAAEEERRAGAMFDNFKRLHDGLNDENKARLASSGIEIHTEGDARAVMGLMGILTLMQN